jgi:hypothetical protein
MRVKARLRALAAPVRMWPPGGQNLAVGSRGHARVSMEGMETMMRILFAMLVLAAGLQASVAEAQTVYVRQDGRLVAVPLTADVPPAPTPSDGGLVRIDGLPTGAMIAVDGRALGGAAEVSGGWIQLSPGPHFIDVALPGGSALRLTVVTPGESSGYQVVPKP